MLIAEAMYRALYARTWIRVAVLVPYGAVTVVLGVRLVIGIQPGHRVRPRCSGSQRHR